LKAISLLLLPRRNANNPSATAGPLVAIDIPIHAAVINTTHTSSGRRIPYLSTAIPIGYTAIAAQNWAALKYPLISSSVKPTPSRVADFITPNVVDCPPA
jgi:hypothetical protein